MVAGQGLRAATVGSVIGIAGAAFVTPLLGALVYEVSPTDGWILTAAAMLLLIVAAVASWLPTRSVARIDPASALRAE